MKKHREIKLMFDKLVLRMAFTAVYFTFCNNIEIIKPFVESIFHLIISNLHLLFQVV